MSLQEDASKHSTACIQLLDAGDFVGALAYCRAQGIEPPTCSLIADSKNAENLRNKAKNSLADFGWWSKRLKIKENRDAVMKRMLASHPA